MYITNLLLTLVSCGTEIGITGYRDKARDSSELSLDTGSSNSLDSNYGITGYANLKLRQVACPSCVGESQEITVSFEAAFHQPSTDGHTEWLLQPGSCTDNLHTLSPSTVPMTVGDKIGLHGSLYSFDASQTANGVYKASGIWESQYERDYEYSVVTEHGDFAFMSSHGFDYIEPYSLLWVDPSYAYDAPIYRDRPTDFYWGPSSSNHTFVITIAVYSWDGSSFLGRIDCAGEDSGSMSIPQNYISQFPSGSLAAIHLNRHKVELSETSINNSFVETHTEWEVVGTGHIE